MGGLAPPIHPARGEAGESVFANDAPEGFYRSRTLARWMAGSRPAMTIVV